MRQQVTVLSVWLHSALFEVSASASYLKLSVAAHPEAYIMATARLRQDEPPARPDTRKCMRSPRGMASCEP